ncbi:DUF3987 domain-containing protein [Rhizobium sp. Leaf341]|uniref:DUF3987 domain-containing protein n=1 Tax=Rhizobium sp. Leaf341 TaxID=1736344 RepID=UPI000714F5DC|nr:DUF3987 domain-containing protein [Rhizobium sp. Leaf341]KQR77595.1 hypothetical protein ASG03_14400 [Rhizobium sp. Leaf341]
MATLPATDTQSAPAFDEAAIRDHVFMLHQLASGLVGKFVVSVFFANPTGEDAAGGVITHHSVGDVEGMVAAICSHAGTPRANVYACPNLMRSSLERGKKGGEADVIAVLALVADLDDDTGRSGSMPIDPDYVIESSPGNYQCNVLLDRYLSPAEAKPLARALKRGANADHCTVDLSHVWRVPGCLNWPNAKKLARGRNADPAPVTVAQAWDGSLTSVEELRIALAPWDGPETHSGQLRPLGELPPIEGITLSEIAVEYLAANDVGDRSEFAARVVEQLSFDGLTAEQACAAFLSATGDWFARYETRDPRRDFERLWAKYGAERTAEREAAAGFVASFIEKRRAQEEPVAANDNQPASTKLVDPWLQRRHPCLPLGILPPIIEEYALSQGDIMGVDPGGLAAAAIAVCAAATPDSITLKMKRHDDWQESPRLWVALVGNPSAKKSPIISAATRALRSLDDELVGTYLAEKRVWDGLDKAGKAANRAPPQIRTRIEDVTVEAAQEILKDSPEGVLLIRDELSGWFGSMERYGTGKGASADRSFWLTAYNGGSYSVNRVGRGVVSIPNLSVSMLGGIQPEAIKQIAKDSADDGLLQRLFPICMGAASVGQDVPPAAAVGQYGALVRDLYRTKRPLMGGLSETTLKFDAAGQDLRQELAEKHHELATGWEILNKKLASHIGKYDGLFGRLCITFHCIDFAGRPLPHVIPLETAQRAAEFLHEFLFPHALAFYTNVLGMSDRHDALLATAGWILTHEPESITVRDVRRGDRIMREMDVEDAEQILRKLDAMSWLDPKPSARRDSVTYAVNPLVFSEFGHRAEKEKARRERARALIASTS